MARGYLDQPAQTAERWVPDPFGTTPGARLYRSGDLGRCLADGNVVFLGRRDGQVKVRGHRIELQEVEAALAEHPGLCAAAAAAFPDAAGRLELAGYGVARGEPAPSAAELRRFLAVRLPAAMVPASLMVLPALPLTRNGKLDRGALPRPPAAPAAGGGGEPGTPRTAAESAVAAIWREVLQGDAPGRNESFFDAGGNSLRLVEVQERLRRVFGREVSALDLFRHPTIASQAALFAPPAPATAAAAVAAAAAAPAGGDVAVIGLAGRFPGAADADELWQALLDGREGITCFSAEELEAAGIDPDLVRRPEYVRANGLLAGADEFDAGFFGMSPREAELTDPQQRLFLELAWTALENAGHAPGLHPGSVGVFAGSSQSRYWFNLAARPDLTAGHEMHLLASNDKDFLPTRTSYKLNLRGPSVAVQTACSSSLAAVHHACRSLAQGECDMALAGGVSVRVPQRTGYLFQPGGIGSPDGHCRPFSAQAAGTVSGSGLGIVVLKRLADAIADGDTIRAVIKGSAINNDGAAKLGYAAPSIDGQAAVIAAALAAAAVPPESIGYVEAHGTGTALGDPVEVAALAQAFRTAAMPRGTCAIGSIKGNIGHLDAASGIAGLIKTVLALEHRQLPPSLHCGAPNPAIDFAAGPFYVNDSLTAWRSERWPLRAGVSSFGIGGTNVHVIVEQAPAAAPAPAGAELPAHLLLLSARSAAGLDTARRRLCDRLGARQERLADVAYTLQLGRRRFPHRLMLICGDTVEAARHLAGAGTERTVIEHDEESERPVAFLFPGQGTQHPRMALDLYRHDAQFRRLVDDGARGLAGELGLDLRRVLFPAPEEEERAGEQLRSTALAQPALFLVEYALARRFMACGVTPAVMVGHSLGEYVAACLAGVFGFADALALVAARGRLMAGCAPGAMVSVAAGEQDLVAELASPDLALAAINGPAQCVISGPIAAIEECERRLAQRRLSFRRLAASHAFHSPLVEPILERFREHVEAVPRHPPRLAMISSVSGEPLADHEALDPGYWVRQLRLPVRFGKALRAAAADPQRALVEVGPGQSLTALARRDPELRGRLALPSLSSPRRPEPDFDRLLETLGRLWLAGVPIDWQGWHGGQRRRRIPLPTYPFERQRYWVDPPPGGGVAARPSAGGRVERWLLHPSWKQTAPAALLAPRRPAAGSAWLVFGGRDGLGAGVCDLLRQRGIEAVLAVPGEAPAWLGADLHTLRPEDAGDHARLLGDLRRQGRFPGFVLYLWSLRRELGDGGGPGPLDLFCHSLLYLAQALALEDQDAPARLHLGLVSAGLHEITGEEALDPEQAVLLGFVRCLPAEARHLTCRGIDLAPAEVARAAAAAPARTALAACLIDELLTDRADEAVAWRHGGRWVESWDPLDLLDPADRGAGERPLPPLREGGVYLITGGLGGMGFELATHLFAAARARLVLVGRSPVPPAGEHQDRLQALAAMGAEVLALSAAVDDPDQLRAALRLARERFGVLHGVIHAAGVPASGLIVTKTAAMARAVLAPKVAGAQLLAAALADSGLDFLVFCSSLRTVLGGAARSDYVAANAFLDAFGYQLRRAMPHTAVLTIDWDTWRDTGMSAAAAAASGMRPEEAFPLALSSAEGVAVFRRALTLGLPRVLVSTQDLDTVRAGARRPMAAAADQPAAPRPATVQTRPLAGSYLAPRTAAERTLVSIWEELLGVQPLGVRENF
ncbi:MAG TPA: SDR family NAD(P)-dependent oxidoreductase, partial [Thermoanaerobaculia bacterium]